MVFRSRFYCAVINLRLKAIAVTADAGYVDGLERRAAPELEDRRDIPDAEPEEHADIRVGETRQYLLVPRPLSSHTRVDYVTRTDDHIGVGRQQDPEHLGQILGTVRQAAVHLRHELGACPDCASHSIYVSPPRPSFPGLCTTDTRASLHRPASSSAMSLVPYGELSSVTRIRSPVPTFIKLRTAWFI